MKRGSTLFLKGFIILIGVAVLIVCVLPLPLLIKAELRGDFDYGYLFLGLYVTAVPFFIALYQALKLLENIDKNKAFSASSVRSLKYIKYCGFTISAMYVAGMPYIFYLADMDDAPGLAALALVIIFSSLVIATFAAVIQEMFQNATSIKSENDQII